MILESHQDQTTPTDVADWSEVAGLQKRMVLALARMKAMAADIGAAKVVIEYDGDRRKRALARAMAAPLAGDASAAKAEAEARASESYSKELSQLSKELTAAMQLLSEYETTRLQWETARSLLSLQRETVRHL